MCRNNRIILTNLTQMQRLDLYINTGFQSWGLKTILVMEFHRNDPYKTRRADHKLTFSTTIELYSPIQPRGSASIHILTQEISILGTKTILVMEFHRNDPNTTRRAVHKLTCAATIELYSPIQPRGSASIHILT